VWNSKSLYHYINTGWFTGIPLLDFYNPQYPLVNIHSLLLKMAIENLEIVDLPIKNVIFHNFLYVYQAGYVLS
jgi:hypothetical protein